MESPRASSFAALAGLGLVLAAGCQDGAAPARAPSPARAASAPDGSPALAGLIDAYMAGFGRAYGPAFAPRGVLVVADRGRIVVERDYAPATGGPLVDAGTPFDVGALLQSPGAGPAPASGAAPRAVGLRREWGALVPVASADAATSALSARDLVARATGAGVSLLRTETSASGAGFVGHVAERGVTVVFLSQVVDFDVARVGRDVLEMAATGAARPPVVELPVRPFTAEELAALAGRYVLTPDSREDVAQRAPPSWVLSVASVELVARGAALFLAPKGQRAYEIFATPSGLWAPEAEAAVVPTPLGVSVRSPSGELVYARE